MGQSGWRGPTIRDVAHEAGVSVATVSRVLAGAPHPVRVDTRDRVRAAAARLGFQPNALARGLQLRVTSTLGVLVPDVGNPYYAGILHGAQAAAQAAGYSLLLGNTDRDPARQAEHMGVFCTQRVNGVLALGGTLGASEVQPLVALGIPTVVIGRHPACVPSVRVDNEAIGRLAAEHLVECGRRRIVFLAGRRGSTTIADRVRGYRQAVGDRGVVLWGELSAEWGEAVARETDADGFVCANDMVALGALHGLRATGRDVPGDVAVVGADDIAIARYASPPLTTVAVPCTLMGRLTAELLLGLVRGAAPPSRPTMLPVELLVRGSTVPPDRVALP